MVAADGKQKKITGSKKSEKILSGANRVYKENRAKGGG